RLREPVAEVVEGEPVQLLRRVREVELAEQALDLALGGRQSRENPALLELARLLVRDGVAGVRKDQPRDVPELVRELAALLDEAVGEADVLRRGHLQQPVAR